METFTIGDVAMDETKRDDAPNSPMTTGAQGSGSDTVSAARISAGTSVGTVGQPARPHDVHSSTSQGSGGSSQTYAAGTSNAGQSGQQSAQGAAETVTRSTQAAADTVRQSAGDIRNRAGEALDQASDWARDQYESGSRHLDWARDQSMRQVRQASSGIGRFVSENPLMVGMVGLAAGLVIGALLPRTRQEDRAFGQWADQVRDQGLSYAREAAHRGREYVEGALGADEDDTEGEWRPEDEGRGGGIRSSGPRYQNH
jgi:ElaB/YqjD/DUF883 family membrane-anchored ribosome-binding protein